MGGFFSSNKEKYLSQFQVDTICSNNPTIELVFNKYKNVDGFLKKDDIFSLFHSKINYKIIKRLYKLAETEKNKLNLQDLKYLYALFHTKDKVSISRFITDLIFSSKNQLSYEQYSKNVEVIFKEDKSTKNKINSLIPNNILKINKEEFQSLIKENYDNILQDLFPIINTSSPCECKDDLTTENKEKLSNSQSNYSRMEIEFNNLKRQNNGLFPIKIFESMLLEVDVNKTLVNYICLYLKKRTQKAFIEFTNLKYIIERFSGNYIDVCKFLYELLIYPEDYLEKKHIENLIKSFKSSISIDEIKKIFDNLKIYDNNIEYNTFETLLKDNANFLIASTERIKYIPYIYFKLRPENIEIQKNTILLVMKGHRELKDFINEIILFERTYYIIDSTFWNSWREEVNWHKEDECKDENIKENKEKKPLKISLIEIVDNHYGKLKQGLVYSKDYFIVTSKIWELFSYWYPTNGIYIRRSRIEYEMNHSINLSIFDTGFVKGKTIYEIEIYPIFFHYLSFDEIAKNIKNYSFESVKEYLSSLNESRNQSNLLIFSKTTKYSEVLKSLESINKLNNINTRLWLYYQSDLIKINNLNVSLNEDKISDYAILVLDVMNNNNKWYSENYLEYNKNNDIFQNSRIGVGLVNIGNTCYMNSVLQIFLNSHFLKSIFLHENFNRTINYQNKYGYKGRVISEFINLLKEKWLEDGKTILPRRWKEIVGEFNSQFKAYDQQDANDFLNFLLDALHEETNLKSQKEYIPNPEKYNGSINELACEYWSNNLRRNVSFIHSLFLGQMKSTLTCMKCSSEKVSFETFSSLNVPIPQKGTINLEVILHRLPFTFKLYYDKYELKSKNIFPPQNNKRNQLLALRKQSLEISFDLDTYLHNDINESQISEKTKIINISNVRLNSIRNKLEHENEKKDRSSRLFSIFPENQSKLKWDDFHTSKLTVAIPIKINIEINKKNKVKKIIEILKSMRDLELEENPEFTNYLILNSESKLVSDDLLIDECFQNNQILNIFEVLNYKGISKIFNYEQIPYVPLNKNCYEYFNKTSQLPPNLNNENIEVLVQIIHRFSYNLNEYFINNIGFNYIQTFPSVLIMLTKNSIKPRDLYEYIWEKYEYFLSNPSKIEKLLWWNNPEQIKKNKRCYPFTLTILIKENQSCVKCPWYRFCNGCVIDPLSNDFIEVMPNHCIVVEWCNEIVKKEINENNIKLVLGHNCVKEKNEEDNKIRNLKECLSLFTEKEDLSDQDHLYCNTCFKYTPNFKKYELERLPQILIIVLKRFKFTKMYRSKIEAFIDFPLYDLDMTEYAINKNTEYKYNLYGIINHSGSLSSGHYTSVVKNWKKWYKYDDSRCIEINENNIKSNNAYILVYTLNNNLENDYLNMMNKLIFYEDELGNSIKPSQSEIISNNIVKSVTAVEIDQNYKYGTFDKFIRSGTIVKPNKVHPAENGYELTNKVKRNSPIKKDYIDFNFKQFNSSSNSKYNIHENFSKFFKGEPVKTSYGRGFYDSEFMDNGIRYIRIKYKYGYSIMKYGNEIEKEIIYNPRIMEELKEDQNKLSLADKDTNKSEQKKEDELRNKKNWKNKSNICSGCNIL